MATYRQLVQPDLGVRTDPGWCLAFTQAVFKAPVMHATAKIASAHTKHRVASRTMPNVAVPVWMDHWGTYGGRYDNFGHVMAWVPGRGFLSSPITSFGQLWFSTLEQAERAFNAKFLFWSLDINTKLVAEKVSTPAPSTPNDNNLQEEDEEDMSRNVCVATKHEKTHRVRVFELTSGEEHQFSTGSTSYIANIAKTYGCTMVSYITNAHYAQIGKELAATRKRVSGE